MNNAPALSFVGQAILPAAAFQAALFVGQADSLPLGLELTI